MFLPFENIFPMPTYHNYGVLDKTCKTQKCVIYGKRRKVWTHDMIHYLVHICTHLWVIWYIERNIILTFLPIVFLYYPLKLFLQRCAVYNISLYWIVWQRYVFGPQSGLSQYKESFSRYGISIINIENVKHLWVSDIYGLSRKWPNCNATAMNVCLWQ